MFRYLYGEVVEIGIDRVVLDVHGVGYLLEISRFSADALQLGERRKLYVLQIIKEDEHSLCGFLEDEERVVFEQLISVSGIGRRVAMGMLSKAPYDKILEWLITGDEKQLTELPGLGKKTAQRLIVELRDKLKKTYGHDYKTLQDAAKTSQHPVQEDVYLALSGLGFKKEEISKMLMGIDLDSLTVEGAIKLALSSRGNH